MANKPLRVLVVGCGNMGAAHSLAYQHLDEFTLCGLVARGDSKVRLRAQLVADIPLFEDLHRAIKETQADAVCIATWPDSHEALALTALAAGCHVFLEKPLATTVSGAKRVVATARLAGKKLVVGYILRHHPVWQQFIELSHGLGKPLVMRMNLNQQSSGSAWHTHKMLMQSLSPIVDCGVHYLDVMCQMAQSTPHSVSAIGVRLSDEIPSEQFNYGQLQVRFEDGSVGWYEAGWGPMMSQTAFFIKDVIGPQGSVSIVAREAAGEGQSANVEAHTRTESLRVHHGELNAQGEFVHQDEWVTASDEPDHFALCQLEQQFFARAIFDDSDLTLHQQQAVESLAVVLAADLAVREQRTVLIKEML
ncbi:Inositol 2-dehydrogenase/D-chiro-inositol 3-dehydrogenase [Buttiauxella agrestis]|uniref:Inositol 2-dehydrogenase/D-chiro-inositol 3-dehydrogenase n=1 Tax=Buttiauxella agrestis TaxID=82977 RepID=A0A381C8A7_9ENTR|nr:Gfo/Idh/MocA family oxidoreductase [Buttiauxella agrestis]SUW64071.1 Inositol 2-dehydrogenase/D-chiro-inositol 3-dehydrogenase [Buttiauxella agrestis]